MRTGPANRFVNATAHNRSRGLSLTRATATCSTAFCRKTRDADDSAGPICSQLPNNVHLAGDGPLPDSAVRGTWRTRRAAASRRATVSIWTCQRPALS